jgi:HSP20 family molecular chaperone IbpA
MNEIATVSDKNGSAGKPYQRRLVAPPVDIFENSEEVLVVADVPGVPSDAIDVRFENDTLTLETKRPSGGKDGPVPALAREYDEVDFVRSFRIPPGIDTANIRGEAKNGTIVVRLPKVAAARARKITVRAA